jgi:hypothetical protein
MREWPIHVRNRHELETLPLPPKSLVISITEPGLPQTMIYGKPLATWRLTFSDADEPLPGGSVLFTSEMAKFIWSDFQAKANEAENIVIQDERGTSISFALAGAIGYLLNGTGRHFTDTGVHNRHVYRLMLEAAGHAVKPEPLVSLCVRVSYPVDRLLAMLLCLRRQRYKNWECLVVTDGPNPDVDQLVSYIFRSLQSDISRIRIVETPDRKGLWGYPHRAFSAEQAKGKYIGFTNDDNYYVPGYFEQMVNELERHDNDLVLCDMVHSYSGWGIRSANPEVGHCDIGNWLARAELVKSMTWDDCQGHHGDGWFVKKMVAAGAKWSVIRKPLFTHC